MVKFILTTFCWFWDSVAPRLPLNLQPSWVLELQACSTMPSSDYLIYLFTLLIYLFSQWMAFISVYIHILRISGPIKNVENTAVYQEAKPTAPGPTVRTKLLLWPAEDQRSQQHRTRVCLGCVLLVPVVRLYTRPQWLARVQTFNFYFLSFFVVLGLELRASSLVGRPSTLEPIHQTPSSIFKSKAITGKGNNSEEHVCFQVSLCGLSLL
jgi:hypothetical protein